MSIGSIGGSPTIGAIAAAQASQPQALQMAGADAGPAAYFDMTGWTGPAEASVTTGPAAPPAPLSELSASVLSAVLR